MLHPHPVSIATATPAIVALAALRTVLDPESSMSGIMHEERAQEPGQASAAAAPIAKPKRCRCHVTSDSRQYPAAVSSRQVIRSDRRLLLAIACFCIGGSGLTAVAILALANFEISRVSRGFLILAVLGVVFFALGAGELVHRMRHGPQRPSRHMRPTGDQSNG